MNKSQMIRSDEHIPNDDDDTASQMIRHLALFACPPEKLLGDGLSTPVPLFCLICTIVSKKNVYFEVPENSILNEPGSIPVDGFDTRLIPRGFSCGVCCRKRLRDTGV